MIGGNCSVWYCYLPMHNSLVWCRSIELKKNGNKVIHILGECISLRLRFDCEILYFWLFQPINLYFPAIWNNSFVFFSKLSCRCPVSKRFLWPESIRLGIHLTWFHYKWLNARAKVVQQRGTAASQIFNWFTSTHQSNIIREQQLSSIV